MDDQQTDPNIDLCKQMAKVMANNLGETFKYMAERKIFQFLELMYQQGMTFQKEDISKTETTTTPKHGNFDGWVKHDNEGRN